MNYLEFEKKQIQENVRGNSEKLLTPLIKKLREKGGSSENKIYDVLENTLKNIIAGFGVKISDDKFKLTPREIGICDLIKSGLENKDISQFLNVSVRTVETHRKNIRRKLNISNAKINLTTYLRAKIG